MAELVLAAELDDLRTELDRLRRKEKRHLVYAFLGFSPSAIIPLIGILLGESVLMIALLLLAVPAVEGWRWFRTAREALHLEKSIEVLLAKEESTGEASA